MGPAAGAGTVALFARSRGLASGVVAAHGALSLGAVATVTSGRSATFLALLSFAVGRIGHTNASLAAAGGAVPLGAGLSGLTVGVVRAESAVGPRAVGSLARGVLALGGALINRAEGFAVAGHGSVLLDASRGGRALEGTVTSGGNRLGALVAAVDLVRFGEALLLGAGRRAVEDVAVLASAILDLASIELAGGRGAAGRTTLSGALNSLAVFAGAGRFRALLGTGGLAS